MLEIYHGAPLNMTGRLEKEIRTYRFLDSLNISFDRVDHEEAMTMEACAEIDKVLEPAVICKNLLLCNSQKTSFYLLVIKGDKKFKTSSISKQIGSSRLSFAPAEYMLEYLDITPGSLSILGLMNDVNKKVELLLDEDILHGQLFGCHPCINTSSIRLSVYDAFTTFLNAVDHQYRVVTVE